MSTFYMVEMNYEGTAARDEFDAFYGKHISMLLTIEGFRTAQRFECLHDAPAPFLAVYQLAGPEVMTSENYTSRAGRNSVDPRFRQDMTNWDRNLVTGDRDDMAVPMGGWLVLIDRLTEDSPDLPAAFTPLAVVGLDATIAERGVLSGDSGGPPELDAAAGWTVRQFRPIHPIRRPA